MKKFDLKDNKRLTSVLAMILASCVVIGLLSSTAIKLASATLLMKSSIKSTNIPIVDKFIEDVLDIPVTPSPAPTTPSTPVTPVTPAPTTKPTEAPTTEAPSTEAPTTEAPETEAPTQAPTQAPTEAPQTEAPETEAPETEAPGQTVEEKQAILKSYKDVVSRAKLKNAQPGFNKVTYRSLDYSFFYKWMFDGVEAENADYFISEEAAKASPAVIPAKTVSTALCIDNEYSACLLNADNKNVVSKAIASASKEVQKDGTVKIVINLNDEDNPKPIKATDKKATSFTSAMFPVVTGEQVRVAMDTNGVTNVDIKYTGCYVELVYKPATGEIVSLKQFAKYEATVKNGLIKGTATVTDVSEYSNFVY